LHSGLTAQLVTNGEMWTRAILGNHPPPLPLGHVVRPNGRGKLTASVLSADGFPLMAGPNFQPLDGNPTIISILRQLADGLENVPEM
jgi:hypothetical protein